MHDFRGIMDITEKFSPPPESWNPCRDAGSRCAGLTLGTVFYFWFRCSLRESDVKKLYPQDLPLILSRPRDIISTYFSPVTLRDLTTVLVSQRLVLSLTDDENLSSNLLTDLKQKNGLMKTCLCYMCHLP